MKAFKSEFEALDRKTGLLTRYEGPILFGISKEDVQQAIEAETPFYYITEEINVESIQFTDDDGELQTEYLTEAESLNLMCFDDLHNTLSSNYDLNDMKRLKKSVDKNGDEYTDKVKRLVREFYNRKLKDSYGNKRD